MTVVKGYLKRKDERKIERERERGELEGEVGFKHGKV